MTTKNSTLKALCEQVPQLEAVVGGCDVGSTLSTRAKAFEELGVQHGFIERWDKYVEE
ncbi:hypothetical protein AAG906_039165 [Vitis piasezkii]